MKTRPFHFKQLFVLLFVLFIVGCSKDEGSDTDEPSIEKPVAKDTLSEEETAKINDFIKGLSYDPSELLNVQSSTGSTSNEGNPQKNTDKVI